LHISGR